MQTQTVKVKLQSQRIILAIVLFFYKGVIVPGFVCEISFLRIVHIQSTLLS